MLTLQAKSAIMFCEGYTDDNLPLMRYMLSTLFGHRGLSFIAASFCHARSFLPCNAAGTTKPRRWAALSLCAINGLAIPRHLR